MEERYADTTDLNYMGLCVPTNGTLGVVAEGSKRWAAPEGDPDGRNDGERWLEMQYEPVLSLDSKIIDVVAWHEPNPQQWWTLTGKGIVLGGPELMRVGWTDLPMYVVSTPAGWRHLSQSPQQLESVCVLDWSSCNTAELFSVVWGTIFCTSESLRRRLDARQLECGGPILLTAVDAGA